MRPIDRALAEANLLPVTDAMLRETIEGALRLLRAGVHGSLAAAETAAARTAASRHLSMPGPILGRLGQIRAGSAPRTDFEREVARRQFEIDEVAAGLVAAGEAPWSAVAKAAQRVDDRRRAGKGAS